MAKKRVGVGKSKKKKFPKSSISQSSKTEKILIENFVSLQKVMVDLSEKFEGLTKQISSLLNLFEDSARTLVKKDLDFGKKDDKELIDRLNSILEQNKLIAKALTLMHDTAVNPNSYYSLAPSRDQRPKVMEESPQLRKPVQKPASTEDSELPFKVPELPRAKPFSLDNQNA